GRWVEDGLQGEQVVALMGNENFYGLPTATQGPARYANEFVPGNPPLTDRAGTSSFQVTASPHGNALGYLYIWLASNPNNMPLVPLRPYPLRPPAACAQPLETRVTVTSGANQTGQPGAALPQPVGYLAECRASSGSGFVPLTGWPMLVQNTPDLGA